MGGNGLTIGAKVREFILGVMEASLKDSGWREKCTGRAQELIQTGV